MKLSRLYSNQKELFDPVQFNPGLNVILAEIRLPENFNADTHNLGKSILARVLDFCFLAKRHPDFFLFKHQQLFQDFEFYLELELAPSSFLTVRRSVSEASKPSFKKHTKKNQDFSDQSDEIWDHHAVPFDRAVQMLDAFIDWNALKPWGFRQGVSYLLRSQDDYSEVFRLRKFAGKHSEWKPYLAHILGFDASLVSNYYSAEVELKEKKATEETVKTELGGSVEDSSEIEGLLLLKEEEADKKQTLLDAFDFRESDKDANTLIVEELDEEISDLNARRYSLSKSRRKIDESINEEQILFNPDEAKELFKQSGVLFEGQIKRDFEQLIEFNRSITDERQQYLLEERSSIDKELSEISEKLKVAGEKRSENLSYLNSTDIVQKYKALSSTLMLLRADIEGLVRQRKFLDRLQQLRKEIRVLGSHLTGLQTKIEENVENQHSDKNSLFSRIRVAFNDIVEKVLDQKALLVVKINSHGHLEFSAEILNSQGKPTSADDGHTYKKLLCIAFDLAIIKSHIGDSFPSFAFHDGVFESLDDRKKVNLLSAIREIDDLGIQHIVTTIDSDLPSTLPHESFISDSEIVLTLHDEGDEGRLFKFASW